ncbi:MAG: hypothetical protein WA459_17995 [Stellaceae bacterium]
MEPVPVEQIAEFIRLSEAYHTAGQVADATKFPKVQTALSDLRDALECRLLTLAGQITAPLH